MAKVTKMQRLCLKLLQEKEKANATVTVKEIAKRTGWEEVGTVRTYIKKDYLIEFLTPIEEGALEFKVKNTTGITAEQFAKHFSQKHAPAETAVLVVHKPAEPTLSDRLLEKSIHAALSAIEIYNKPDFKYREETFSILMVNAWETLLKAKCVKDAKEDLSVIQVKEKNPSSNISRCGNVKTIDIFKAARLVNVEIDLLDCLDVLVEIRDNAIHFMNSSLLLNKKVLEVGTASLRSYVEMVKEWFAYDLSQYNFYLMPLSFFHPHEMESYSIHTEDEQHQNLLRYIANRETEKPSDPEKRHNISLILETKFAKSSSIRAQPVRVEQNNPNAVPVVMSVEELFRNKFIWSCQKHLLPALYARYSDFSRNKEFFARLKEVQQVSNERLCKIRYSNEVEQTGGQWWYDPNIVPEFDKYYALK